MRGIILLEGPDGSGKTTLANRLIEKYGGVYIHAEYRFKNKMPQYHGAILHKAWELSKKQLVIIDRLHISEMIYAKVFRGGSPWPWMLKHFNRVLKMIGACTILCIPRDVETGIKWFEQAKQERPEMYDDIRDVIQEYIHYAHTHDCIIYNKDMNDKPIPALSEDYPDTKYMDLIELMIKHNLRGAR